MGIGPSLPSPSGGACRRTGGEGAGWGGVAGRPFVPVTQGHRGRPSVVIQAVGSPRVQAVLPGSFQSNDFGGFHVRRDSLENREAEIPAIAASEQFVSAMPAMGIALPSAQKVVFAIGRTDIAHSIRGVEDEVDGTPLAEGIAPSRGNRAQLLPGKVDFVPCRQGNLEGAFFPNGEYGKVILVGSPPPGSFGRRPGDNQFPLPFHVEISGRQVEKQSFWASLRGHPE